MTKIFLLSLLLIFASPPLAFAANSSDYLVENIVVNVNSKTPNDAKNLAVKTARRDGFIILLTRLELKVRIADYVSDDEISDMVRSEQTENEKFAGNNYSATFNIMFDKKFVDHILSQKNVDKISTTEKESYLLIPVKLLKRKVILWEDSNDWKKAIEKNISQAKSFTVPASDVENIAFLNRDNVLTANYGIVEPLLNRYNAGAAYLAFFTFDESENKVRIEISYITKLQNRQTKLSFINADHLDYQTLLDKVASKAIKYLSEAKKDVGNYNPSLINIAIPISTFGNWMQTKNKIEGSNLINQLSIRSISKDYAVITVNYVDARVDIAQAFANIGISLNKKSDNFYILSR